MSNTPVALILGGLFLIGLAADLVGRFTILPRVTLLLIAGILIGPSGFSLLPDGFAGNWFPPLTGIALALIGFLLGQQLSGPALRKRGRAVIGISLCKVFGVAILVATALMLVGVHPVVALLLAGVAPATDPAATFDQVHESGEHNEFTDTLLSIVAVDDVWGLLIFVLMAVVAGLISGDSSLGVSISSGLSDLGGSIVLGVALGIPMAFLTGRIRPGEPTLVEAVGFVLLGAGLADSLHLIPVLTAMAMGITVATFASHHERPFHAIEGIEWPFLILFFVLAGASLDLNAVYVAGGLTAVYIVTRGIGIYAGARAGARLVGADSVVGQWLGLALQPQAGVAIGMALLAAQRFPDLASVVLTVTVASTIILETIGPMLTRLAIRRAGA